VADVLIVGGGVGGLTLALCLHRNGVPCFVLEAAPEFRALGVGINILPHAAAELARLGLEDELTRVAVLTDEASFFNRFGQLVHSEPLGRAAGYAHPQFSIHRADLHGTLLRAVRERLGADRILLGRRLAAAEQDAEGVTLRFEPDGSAAAPQPVRGAVAVGCDGIHSVLRRQLHPGEGEPKYTGYNMWRGVAPGRPS
jgi:2-polyprenyl-6-methoxyphenol hydroxylase-like FAD-dependent oxidoreductase